MGQTVHARGAFAPFVLGAENRPAEVCKEHPTTPDRKRKEYRFEGRKNMKKRRSSRAWGDE
jgi:hypothetical protein